VWRIGTSIRNQYRRINSADEESVLIRAAVPPVEHPAVYVANPRHKYIWLGSVKRKVAKYGERLKSMADR
jgi:hypothetical protein